MLYTGSSYWIITLRFDLHKFAKKMEVPSCTGYTIGYSDALHSVVVLDNHTSIYINLQRRWNIVHGTLLDIPMFYTA